MLQLLWFFLVLYLFIQVWCYPIKKKKLPTSVCPLIPAINLNRETEQL